MAAADTAQPGAPTKRWRLSLLVGLLLALVLGGGGFYAAYSGLLDFAGPPGDPALNPTGGGETAGASGAGSPYPGNGEAPRFVPLDPIVVMLGEAAQGRHLRFRAVLEVAPAAESAVVSVKPRILDVLNGYLRAVPVDELESPAALSRLRAQMLRRIQIVAGGGAVRDLLVAEFVLN